MVHSMAVSSSKDEPLDHQHLCLVDAGLSGSTQVQVGLSIQDVTRWTSWNVRVASCRLIPEKTHALRVELAELLLCVRCDSDLVIGCCHCIVDVVHNIGEGSHVIESVLVCGDSPGVQVIANEQVHKVNIVYDASEEAVECVVLISRWNC